MIVAKILRDETRDEHARTEATFAGFDIGTRDGYKCFLIAQASAFLSIERSLEVAGVADVIEDWADRRRGDLLRSDLAQLDIGDVPLQRPLCFASVAELLGGAYVMEGSRLGGKLLSRRAPNNVPVRFIGSEGKRGAWKQFLSSLENKLGGPSDIGLAVAAAKSVFRGFETAARETLERRID